MKRGNIIQTVKVGVFASIAIGLITSLIFYIGSNQQSIGSQKRVTVIFKNVGGLKAGNAIRYAGVIVGAVDKIKIVSDSAVEVTLLIDEADSKFIKKDSKVSISTEGLVGSKYIRISTGSPDEKSIEDDDQLTGIEPLDYDELMNTFSESGKNIEELTQNAQNIMSKIDSGGGLLHAIISDPILTYKINETINSLRSTWNNASKLSVKMNTMADTFNVSARNAVVITTQMKEFTKKMNSDSTSLGKIVGDTIMARQIDSTLTEVKTTVADVKLTSETVRDSWILNLFGGKKNKKDKQKK